MKKLYKLITLLLLLLSFGKLGAQTSRIIAAQTDKHDGTSWVHYDSSKVIYNFGNNATGDATTFYPGMMQNDTTISLFYAAAAYNPLYKHGYHFDAQGHMLQHHWQQYSAGTWKNYQNEIYTYDGNGNMLSQKVDRWDATNNVWKNFYLDSRYYSGNQMASDSLKYWDATLLVWYYNSAHTYTYSGDTTFDAIDSYDYGTHTWSHSSKVIDVHDANNNRTLYRVDYWYSWLNNYRKSSNTTSAFNAANLMTSYVNQYWDTVANAWLNSDKNTYTYNVNNVLTVDSGSLWNTATSTWYPYTATTHHTDSTNYTDTALTLQWNTVTSAYDNYSRGTGTFNTYYQITSSKTEHWKTATSTWDGLNNDRNYKYYYELVNLAVPSVAVSQPQVILYPSPANTVVNLSINWDKATSFTISVYDMQGRIMKHYMENNIKDYKGIIPVADLPTGNYNVIISSGAVTTAERFTILK